MDHRRSIESYNTGLALASQGEWEAAAQALRRSLRMDPGNVEALNLLGKVSMHLGDPRQAEILWLQSLAQDPGNPTARRCLDALSRPSIGRWLLGGLLVLLLLFAIAMLLWLWMEVHAVHEQIRAIQNQPVVVMPTREASKPTELLFHQTSCALVHWNRAICFNHQRNIPTSHLPSRA